MRAPDTQVPDNDIDPILRRRADNLALLQDAVAGMLSLI